MSFILDALKKSETERQEQGATEFSRVPTSSGNASPARWLWLLAALLLVNFAVLLAVLLKPNADSGSPVSQPIPSATANTATRVAAQPPVASESAGRFSDQVASAVREQRPAVTAVEPAPESPPASATPASPPPRRSAARSSVPTLEELRLSGAINVAELHLDIHVFSDDPAARFVFINMDKHREGERIDEGPVVQEITPDGVILEYQGQDFLLSRQ